MGQQAGHTLGFFVGEKILKQLGKGLTLLFGGCCRQSVA